MDYNVEIVLPQTIQKEAPVATATTSSKLWNSFLSLLALWSTHPILNHLKAILLFRGYYDNLFEVLDS